MTPVAQLSTAFYAQKQKEELAQPPTNVVYKPPGLAPEKASNLRQLVLQF